MTEKDEARKNAEQTATDELAKQAKSDGDEAEQASERRGMAEKKLRDLRNSEAGTDPNN